MYNYIFLFLLAIPLFSETKYILGYQTFSNTGLMQYDLDAKKGHIYVKSFKTDKYDSVHINDIFYVSDRIFINTYNGASEIVNNKIKKLVPNRKIRNYYNNKLIVSVYEHDQTSIYLVDLNFEKRFLIDTNFEQNRYKSFFISSSEFFYVKKSKNKKIAEAEFWIYNFKSKEKRRIRKLEENCESPFAFRQLTQEFICKDYKHDYRHDLVSLEGKRAKSFKLNKSSHLIYYDMDKDILFYNVMGFDFFEFTEVHNLYIYDFKTKKSKKLKEDITVKSMDRMK